MDLIGFRGEGMPSPMEKLKILEFFIEKYGNFIAFFWGGIISNPIKKSPFIWTLFAAIWGFEPHELWRPITILCYSNLMSYYIT